MGGHLKFEVLDLGKCSITPFFGIGVDFCEFAHLKQFIYLNYFKPFKCIPYNSCMNSCCL